MIPSRCLFVTLCRFAILALPAAGQDQVILSREAGSHVGETIAVRGLVAAVFTSRNQNVFLNFDRPYPDQAFQAVIFHPAAGTFGDLRRYEGKTVTVVGRIQLYHGKPEMILDSPSQIRLDAGATTPAAGDSGPPAPVRGTRPCVIAAVYDGDTVACAGGERVRLIGIDAPETDQAPFGGRARGALLDLTGVGDTVRLESDVEPRDQYGRSLAYVWKGATLVNWVLVRRGWAVQFTHAPNVQYVDRFTEAEERARTGRAGLWAIGGFDCRPADHRHGRCD